MPKLSATQAALLSAAAARSDRSVLPAPATLKLKGAALAQALKALRGRGLIAEAPIERRARRSKWAGAARRGGRAQPPDRHAGRPRGDRGRDGAGGRPAPRSREDLRRTGLPRRRRESRPGGRVASSGVLLDAVARPEGRPSTS